MPAYLPHIIRNNHFLLTAEKTAYWEEQQILIISDMHLGKSGHFRKNGIAVPTAVFRNDMQKLLAGLQFFKPKELIIVGDLFHSNENKEWPFLQRWLSDMPQVNIHLVRGNHDILHDNLYQDAGILVHDKLLSIGDMAFVHDMADITFKQDAFIFSGHVHPAVVIKGQGKQSMRLPCFFFTQDYAILPSYGSFTGLHTLNPSTKDHVFVIAGKEVMQLQ